MPSPIQISTPTYSPAPFIDDATGMSQSMSHMASGGGMRSPTSPRPSFLPSFMRRPRAATSDSMSRPPSHQLESSSGVAPSSSSSHPSSFHFNNGGPPSPQPIPSSSESLQSPSTPPPNHPPSSSTNNNRRRTTTNSPGGGGGGLPSPPLSSSHQQDPLAGFGHRLLRRISNQGGSSSAGGAGSATSLRPTSAGAGGGGGRSSSTPPAPSHAFGLHQRPEQEGLELQRETPRGEHAPTSTIIITNPSNPIPSSPFNSVPFVLSPGAESDPVPASQASLLPPTTPNVNLTTSSPSSSGSGSGSTAIHRLRLVPLLDASHSLPFDPVVRDVRESPGDSPSSSSDVFALKIGRFTDKQSGADGTPRGGALNSTKVAFKSKVVSRCHAEVWAQAGGKFFVKDTKSSSGTFLNHIRLSPPSVESKPFAIKDGDVIQLGVDYQGGTEEIYRCVKMKVELGRGWQSGANTFNTNALKQLNALRGDESSLEAGPGKEKAKKIKANVTDCVICLFSVTICQSLFIAPCSHVFHYKCIRPLLSLHHPGFSCPVCRSFADLEADVETDDVYETSSRRESLISRKGSLKSVRQAFEQALGSALHASEVGDADNDDDEEEGQGHHNPEPSRSGLRPFGSPVGAASRLAAEEGSRPESSGRPETAVAQPRTADLGYSPSAGFGERLAEASTAEEFAGVISGGGGSRPIPERNETLSNDNDEEDVHAEIGGGISTSSHPTLTAFPSSTSSLGLGAARVESPSGGADHEEGTRRVSFEEELAGSGLLGRVEELDTISEGGVVVEGGEGMVRSVKEGAGEPVALGEDGEGSTGGSSSGV